MKIILTIFTILISLTSWGQADTIVVHDYTKLLISVGAEGEVRPAINLDETTQAGFFLNEIPEGQIKICNENLTYVWANGRLIDSFDGGCMLYEPSQILSIAGRDSVYVSIYAQEGFSSLTCQLITFEDLLIIKEDPKNPREARSYFREFNITCVILLLLSLGLILLKSPARMTYVLSKALTFKTSSYEFVNTNFISVDSIQLTSIMALFASYFTIYYDQLLGLKILSVEDNFVAYLFEWIRLGLIIFGLILVKWMVVSAISKLFSFREINNYQLFDFVNFTIFLFIPVFVLTIIDFVVNPPHSSWIPTQLEYVFPSILILFIIWFSFKFVSNTPRRKLMIISYLCATEIIPALMFLGWFYK